MNSTENYDELSLIVPMDNNTLNETYVNYANRIETYVVPVIFALIFIVGLLGNGTLVVIFIRNKSMRSIPNTYIMSLATGDLLVITVTVPFVSTIYVFESWPFGEFICKLSEFLRDMSTGVTVLTLVALSAERYIAIVKPVLKHISGVSKKGTMFTALGIWAASILIAFPSAYFSHISEFNISNHSIHSCYPFAKDIEWYPKAVVLSRFLIFYILPMIMITFFYALMAHHLYASSQKAIGETTGVQVNGKLISSGQRKQMLERKKVAKIVLTFVVIFAVCFLPFHIFNVWFHFNPNSMIEYDDFWHSLRIIGFLLVFINSCINPITLYCLSAVFRKFFNRYIFCCNRQLSQAQRRSMVTRSEKNNFNSTVASAVSYL